MINKNIAHYMKTVEELNQQIAELEKKLLQAEENEYISQAKISYLSKREIELEDMIDRSSVKTANGLRMSLDFCYTFISVFLLCVMFYDLIVEGLSVMSQDIKSFLIGIVAISSMICIAVLLYFCFLLLTIAVSYNIENGFDFSRFRDWSEKTKRTLCIVFGALIAIFIFFILNK